MADERPDGHDGRDGRDRRDDGDGGNSTPADEPLERLLRERAPLLRRRREVGAPDAAFVARLRARLLNDEATPDAATAQTSQTSGAATRAPAAAVPGRLRLVVARRRGVAAGLAAALVVTLALLVALVLLGRAPRPAHAPAVAWQPPLPSVADLTRGFPAPPAAPATVARDPTASLAAPPHGIPYAGRVTLSAAPLPARVFRLLAFRLAAPASVASPQRVTLLARRLGLRAPARRLVRGTTAWMVAAEGGPPSRRPLHSLAVDTASGELVYHDASYARTMRQEVWRDNAAVTAAARRWLILLGWPGARMPLVAVEHSGLPLGLREIEFGWAGVGPSATDAATLWLTPAGRVVEADVLPPTESVRAVAARSLATAWSAVRSRIVPLAVEGVPPTTTAPGVGVMSRVTVAQVLSAGPDRRLYLVPTYRFAGTARLRGIAGARPCYTLAPAGQT